MSRICRPCSSIALRDCWPARPECGERRRALPFPKTPRCYSPETCQRLFHRARFGTWPWALLHLLYDLLKFLRHLRNALAPDLHVAARSLADNNIERTELVVLARKIVSEMRPAAFFPLESRLRYHFRDHEQVVEVNGSVPPRVVFAMALDADPLGAILKLLNMLKSLQHLFLLANDADQVLHHVL